MVGLQYLFLVPYSEPQNTGTPHFIVPSFIAFTNLFFKQIEICGNPASSNSTDIIFPKAAAHFVSVSHSGNSHSTSNFFIIKSIHYDDL